MATEFGLDLQDLQRLASVFREDLLRGQRILIAGGNSGIGKAVAWLCGRLGAELVVLGRNPEKLHAAVTEMRDAGLQASGHPVNIREPDQIRELLQRIVAERDVDALVNSAGGQFPKPALEISDHGWHAVVDTNLNGSWYLMQSMARLWRQAGRGGSVVNIAAVVDRGMVDMAHSAAARAGVIALSKTLAVEWAPLNIRINCIAPGVIASEGMRVYDDKARAAFPASNPMQRFGSPWEIAQAVVYLLSDAAEFITGDTMTVDGGGRLWGELWPYGKPDYFKV